MKAKEYVERVRALMYDGADEATAVSNCLVNLMQEVNELLKRRGALKHGKCKVDTATRCIKELNQKWRSIHKQLGLPDSIQNIYIEACKREWPQLKL